MQDFKKAKDRLKKKPIDLIPWFYALMVFVLAYTAITHINSRTRLELCKAFNDTSDEIVNCYFNN